MKNVLKTIAIFILLSVIVNAQSNMKINVMADLNSPTDKMGEAFQNGFGAHAGILFKLSDSWDLGASFGYTKWDAENDHYSKLLSGIIGSTVTVEVDMPYTAIPVMLDAYYYFSRENFQPYLTFSLGVHFTNVEYNPISINGKSYDLGESESQTVAGYKFGGGFLYNFSSKIALNILATYDGNTLEFAEAENAEINDPSNITTTYINIGVGLSISL